MTWLDNTSARTGALDFLLGARRVLPVAGSGSRRLRNAETKSGARRPA